MTETFAEIADAEAIVSDYLRSVTGARVMGGTPGDLAAPWVRVTQLDAANEEKTQPEHLIVYMLQIDCYAGAGNDGQEEAQGLAAQVRGALAAMSGSHNGAVVSAVRFSGHARVPDTSLEPARQRYILTAHVYMHAA